MSQPFDVSSIPYCTKDLRSYFQVPTTKDELRRFKQYFQYQKNLRRRFLSNDQQLFNRQSNRFNHRLYIDKKSFDNYGFSLLRSNPNVFILNEKRFNRTLNSFDLHQSSLHHIVDIHETGARLESQQSMTSIDTIESPIQNIAMPVIRLNTCSQLIATGHGIAKMMSALHKIDIEQWKYNTIDEDISLSKTCPKVSNRILLRRQINPKSSNIHLFATSEQLSQVEF